MQWQRQRSSSPIVIDDDDDDDAEHDDGHAPIERGAKIDLSSTPSPLPSPSRPTSPPLSPPSALTLSCFNCSHLEPYDTSTTSLQCTNCGLSLQIPSPPSPPPSPRPSPSPSPTTTPLSPSYLDELLPLLPPCAVCSLPLTSPPLAFLCCGHLIHDRHKLIYSHCTLCHPCTHPSPKSDPSRDPYPLPPYPPSSLTYVPREGELARYRTKKEGERRKYGSEKGPCWPLFLSPLDVARMLVHGDEEEEDDDGGGDEDGEGNEGQGGKEEEAEGEGREEEEEGKVGEDHAHEEEQAVGEDGGVQKVGQRSRQRRPLYKRVARLEARLAEEEAALTAVAKEVREAQVKVKATEAEVEGAKEAVRGLTVAVDAAGVEKGRVEEALYDLRRAMVVMDREDGRLRGEMEVAGEDKAMVLKEDGVGWGGAEGGGGQGGRGKGAGWSVSEQRDRWQHLQVQLLKYRTAMRTTGSGGLDEQVDAAKARRYRAELELDALIKEVEGMRREVEEEGEAVAREGEGRRKRGRVDLTRTAIADTLAALSDPPLQPPSRSPSLSAPPPPPPLLRPPSRPFAAYQSSSSLLPPASHSLSAGAATTRFPSFRAAAPARDPRSVLHSGPDGKGGVVLFSTRSASHHPP